ADLLVARADDDHAAILFEDEVVSYRELVAAAAARAALLAEARRGGPFHVGVLLENVPEYLYWIACAALAGAAVPGRSPTRPAAVRGSAPRSATRTASSWCPTPTAPASLLGSTSAWGASRSSPSGRRPTTHGLPRTPARRRPRSCRHPVRGCCCCSRRARRA